MKNLWLEPRTIVAYALSLLALAEIVDLTIVAVAIPHIMGSLNANLTEISLTITSYIVAAAVFIPLTGLVTRKFGMKNVVMLSAILFGVSSVLCGMATSLTEMIIFRLMQGIGGAFLPSIAQSYISQNFTAQEQTKVMTMYGLCVVMGPIIGPVFGGALTENLSWRWIFYVNVPICMLGLILVWIFMKNKVEQNVRIDYISFAFMAFGVAALEYFIDEGNTNNWLDSMEMVIILTIAVVLLIFFIWRGLLGKSVVNFTIFKYKNFVLSCLSMFMFMLMVAASMAYFPTMLQNNFNYPVDTAGYITAPRGIAAFIAAPIIVKLMAVVDARKIMMMGLLLFAISCFMTANFGPQLNQINILITVLIQGVGMMCFFVPIMQIVFIDLPEELHNDASGIFNFFRNIASSIGTSVSATIVSQQMQVTWNDMGNHISSYARGYVWWEQNLNNMPEQLKIGIASLKVMSQGTLLSYLDSFYIFGVFLLLSMWLPMLLTKPNNNNPIRIGD